jgi:hypothetical protein
LAVTAGATTLQAALELQALGTLDNQGQRLRQQSNLSHGPGTQLQVPIQIPLGDRHRLPLWHGAEEPEQAAGR